MGEAIRFGTYELCHDIKGVFAHLLSQSCLFDLSSPLRKTIPRGGCILAFVLKAIVQYESHLKTLVNAVARIPDPSFPTLLIF